MWTINLTISLFLLDNKKDVLKRKVLLKKHKCNITLSLASLTHVMSGVGFPSTSQLSDTVPSTSDSTDLGRLWKTGPTVVKKSEHYS